MMHRRLRCLVHTSRALLVLAALGIAAEIGMRVYAARYGAAVLGEASDTDLLADSWVTHRELKPLHVVQSPAGAVGPSVEIRTNSQGLRGREITMPKPPGVYRVICLGDETVYGVSIAETELFCTRLEELLQPMTPLDVEVVNAGVPGFCPLLSYLQVKHRLLGLQPDLLILTFDMGDVAEDYRYRRHTRVDERGLPLVCTHPALEVMRRQEAGLTDHSFLARWWKHRLGGAWKETVQAERDDDIGSQQGRYAWLMDDPPNWDVYVEQAFSSMADLQVLTRESHSRLIVATYPTPWQVSATACAEGGVRRRLGVPEGEVYSSERPFELLSDFLRAHQIPMCNVSRAFRNDNAPDGLFLHHRPRFSAEGHALFAAELAEFVMRHVPGIWNEGLNPTETTAPIRRHPLANDRRPAKKSAATSSSLLR